MSSFTKEPVKKVDPLAELTVSRRITQEALGHGRAALEALDSQGEVLDSTEDTLEANEYVLQKSLRVLRGMTWSGWVYNAFSSEGKPISATLETTQETNPAAKMTPTSSSSAEAAVSRSQASGLTAADKSGRLGVDAFDRNLEEISASVAELHGMSLLIGETLETHSAKLDRIERKTEVVQDKTLSATLKAAQLASRSRRSASSFVGRFQFIDVHSKRFLTVDSNECIAFTRLAGRGTYFDCYSKENNIIGVQNMKTLTYLGSTWLSTVKGAGKVFGKQEECHMNLRDGEITGLYFLSINWGGGGWLKQPELSPSEEADQPESVVVSAVTSSVIDKAGAVTLRVVLVSDKEEECDFVK